MAKFSDQAIETIKSRLTLSEVVGAYVHLDRRGDRHWGCCPFHHEKTPSFTVLDREGFFHCFGCGKGGDMFKFVQEMEKVDFPTAVEILAKKAGVELREATEQEKRFKDRRDTVQDIYNKLMNSFNSILKTMPVAEKALEYVRKRGISDETIERFKLGYAIPDGRWLYSFLKKKNYSDEVLNDSGFFVKNNWTMFCERLMFPILDWRGNCVAFSGRDLTFADDARKYVNSRDTLIYNKKEHLFGLYQGLQDIKERGEVTICEGNFDVISLHQAGLRNSVASLGTAFTAEQAKLLKRYCQKVNLLFDNDAAGQAATFKAATLCQQAGLECSVILLEGAKDTSELLEKEGPEALVKACSKKTNVFGYLVKTAINKYDIRQPKQRTKVLEEVKPFLDATDSMMERQGYVKYLADVLGTDEENVSADYSATSQKNGPQKDDGQVVQARKALSVGVELHAMLLALNRRDLFPLIKDKIRIDQLEDPNAQVLYQVLENAEREGATDNSVILEMIGDNESLRDAVVKSFVTPEVYSKNESAPQEMEVAVIQIRKRRLKEKSEGMQRLIALATADNLSDEEMTALLAEKSELDQEIRKLDQLLAGNGEND